MKNVWKKATTFGLCACLIRPPGSSILPTGPCNLPRSSILPLYLLHLCFLDSQRSPDEYPQSSRTLRETVSEIQGSVAESQAEDFSFALLGQLATMQNWLGGQRRSQRVTITMGTIAGTFKNFELVGYLEVARYAALK